MNLRLKGMACGVMAEAFLAATSATAAYPWTINSPKANPNTPNTPPTVKWSAIPCDLTLDWGANDPRPTQIGGFLEVNGVEYPATQWTNLMFSNAAHPASQTGQFWTNYMTLGQVAGTVRFKNYFNAMVNSTSPDVAVTVTN